MPIGDEVIIGVRTTGTEESAASLAPVKAGIEALGTAAGSVTGNMELLNEKIAAIRNSGAPIEEQTAALTRLRDATAEAAGAFESMGAAGESGAATMSAAVARLNEELPAVAESAAAAGEAIAGAASVAEVKLTAAQVAAAELAAKLETMGVTGAEAMDLIGGSTETVDEAFARWEQHAATNSRGVRQSFISASAAVGNFREKVIEAYGTLEAAPPGVQSAMAGYTKGLDAALIKTREVITETRILKNEMQQGGAGFKTLEEGLKDLGGGFGGAAAQAGVFYIAMQASYHFFREIADAIGVDQQAMDGLKHSMAEWGKNINTELVENLTAFASLMTALSNHDIPAAKQAMKELKDTSDALNFSVFHGKEATDGYRLAIAAKVSAEERDKISINDLTKVHEIHAKAVFAGSLAVKQYAKATEDAHGNTNAWLAALSKLGPEFDKQVVTVKKVMAAIAEEERERGKAIGQLQAHVDAIDAVIAESKKEAAEFGTVAAAMEHLFAARQKTLNALKDLEPAVKGSTLALADQFKELSKLTGAYELNEPAIKALLPTLQGLLDHTYNLTEAQRKNYQGIIDGMKTIDALKTKQTELDKVITDGIKANDGHRKSFDELTAAEAEQLKAAYKAQAQNQTDIDTKKEQLAATSALAGGIKDTGYTIAGTTEATKAATDAEDKNKKALDDANVSLSERVGKLKEHAAVITNATVAESATIDKANQKIGELIAAETGIGPAATLSADQAIAVLKKMGESSDAVKDVIADTTGELKTQGEQMKSEILPKLADMKKIYEGLKTEAEQHAEAVERLSKAWTAAGKAAEQYGAIVSRVTADSEAAPEGATDSYGTHYTSGG